MTLDEKALESAALAMLHKTCDHYGDPRPTAPDLSLTSMMAETAITAYLSASKPAGDVEKECYNEVWEENRKLREINWNLGVNCLPAHTDLLEAIADEIDCGDDCDHGSTEWDTNAFVCRKIDEGTCGWSNAEVLRSIAKSFRERAALASSQAVSEPSPRVDAEVADLVKRLRARRERVHDLSGVSYNDDEDCHKAAHVIEQQASALSRLAAQEPVGWLVMGEHGDKNLYYTREAALERSDRIGNPVIPLVEKKGHEAFKVAVAHQKRAEAAEAKVERLEKALEKIDALDEDDGHSLKAEHAFEAVAIARNALLAEAKRRSLDRARTTLTASASDHQQSKGREG